MEKAILVLALLALASINTATGLSLKVRTVLQDDVAEKLESNTTEFSNSTLTVVPDLGLINSSRVEEPKAVEPLPEVEQTEPVETGLTEPVLDYHGPPREENPYLPATDRVIQPAEVKLEKLDSITKPASIQQKTKMGPAQQHMSRARACSCCHQWSVNAQNEKAECATGLCSCEDPSGLGGKYCWSDLGVQSFIEGVEAQPCVEEDLLSNSCDGM